MTAPTSCGYCWVCEQFVTQVRLTPPADHTASKGMLNDNLARRRRPCHIRTVRPRRAMDL